MDKILNRMLSGLATPFPQLTPDKIFLVMDEKGNADPSFKSIFKTYHEPLLQYVLEKRPCFQGL